MDRKSKLCLSFLKTNKKNADNEFKKINSEVSNKFDSIGLNVNVTEIVIILIIIKYKENNRCFENWKYSKTLVYFYALKL